MDKRTDTPSSETLGKVLILNGPNLNLLGQREPHLYGVTTLADIDRALAQRAENADIVLETFQSNHEGALIERLHAARTEGFDFLIINPAAFTHTSIALRDAVLASDLSFIEVHLSNVHAREPFRHHSYFSDKAVGTITGLGAQGYLLAFDYIVAALSDNLDPGNP
ncbi:MAG: type II 3-dehydroquinate dehydratase [Fluviibacter sp.]|jgi:3-dehydroquinate dehydratase-2